MGSIRGKLEVGLYADANPMVEGFKKGEQAAKRASGNIANSIEKINEKQIKNMGTNFLKNVSIVGAADIGLKMAEEMLKGFKDGSIKGIPDAVKFTVQKITDAFGELPIYGSIMRLSGAGADAVSGGTMDQESGQERSRAEFAIKQKEISQKDKFALMEAAGKKEIADRIANESAAKQKKLDEEDAKVKKFYADQRISSEQEILKIKDDLRKASMSERDIEVERIQNLKTLPQYMKDEGVAAYDALVALREKLDLEKDLAAQNKKSREDSNKQALDGQNDLAEARKAYAETEAELNAQAAGTSNVEGLSTAIGSIKVAGSTDFSIEKQVDIAKQQLNAAELHTDILQEIADSLNAMGATT